MYFGKLTQIKASASFRRLMNRQKYLTSIWQNYPSLNDEEVVRIQKEELLKGKILSISKYVSFTSQAGEFSFPVEEAKIDNQYPSSILQIGDIILYNPEKKEIKLLVPGSGVVLDKKKYEVVKKWNQFLFSIRSYFKEQDFLEVRTPSLVKSPGVETYIDPIQTNYQKLFLPTSPELHLKKYLVRGFERIYEIKEVYRFEDISSTHQPEFLMLEWYRSYDNLSSIEKDLKNLCQKIYKSFYGKSLAFQRMSMKEAFFKYADFSLSPKTSKKDLSDCCDCLGIEWSFSDTWNDLFHRIFLERIESRLDKKKATIIYDFPPQLAALAKLNDEGWAERFEFYFQGLEIANAYHELNSWEEQGLRFEKTNQERLSLGSSEIPVDEDFMEHLKLGLPPSGGIALGVERLFMAISGIENIEEVYLFSHHLQEEEFLHSY